MILRGILQRSLGGFLCIRGNAPLGDLERVSYSDDDYQRKLIDTHRAQIEDFLNDKEYLFFPEVILACTLRYTSATSTDDDTGQRPLMGLDAGMAFQSNVNGLKISIATKAYKGTGDVRAKELVRIAQLTIPEAIVESVLDDEQSGRLFRIDGNHRISAAKGNSNFQNLSTPFCVVLFEEDNSSKRSSKVIFHNINSKSVPLTPEHNLKLILDEEALFSDALLKGKTHFGWQYYLARKLAPKLLPEFFGAIKGVLDERRSALVELFKFLLDGKAIKQREEAVDEIFEAIQSINMLYENNPLLKGNRCVGLFVAFVYFHLKAAKGTTVAAFERWVCDNHLRKLKEVDAGSLVEIFGAVQESRSRQIFVSMQFCDETNETWLTIKETIERLNAKHDLEIKLEPIRIDKFDNGHSYTITDEILKLIDGSGLLIADLTMGNKNVYHELGFLMGLNQGRAKPQNNFILILDSQRKPATVAKDVGFNIANIQQVRFKSTRHLEERLTAMVEKFYKL